MENYVGKRLDGRYEIRDVVGVGGMAVVYKAYDNIDDRIVAVKILKDEYLTNEEFRRRFKNESKAIAVLSHKNIVKVFDVSFGDRLQYIVMEYIEGITLKEYIEQRGVIGWKEALFFSIQILRALQHAHDKGIVHRDVKPQNIMLLQDGTIKVTDFGIARFSHSETRTMTEKAIGSVHYISPEQAKGELTDEKADLYSVGVVLYEMLTGKLPFDADSAVSVALMQVNNEPVLPRNINPDIPLGFEQITLKAMQKNTRERYQSASEVLMDLEELKRNPNIKFDYHKYFVDDQPTRFVDGIGSDENAEPDSDVKIVPPASDVRSKFDDVRSVSSKKSNKIRKNKIIAIVSGIAVAILIIAVLLLAEFFSSDSFFLGFGEDVEVPKFVGLNYEEDIKDNSEYSDFKFEEEYVYSSDDEPGTVISQDPEPGKTVKKNKVILLTIATNGDLITIPNGYIGEDYNEVCNSLRELGLIPNALPREDENSEPYTVLSINPMPGSSVKSGTEVVVYYAVAPGDDDFFDMPDFRGKDLSEVKALLVSKGLELGSVDVVDNSADKDVVIEQSVPANTPVKKGEKIDIVVSSGRNILTKSLGLPSGVGALSVEVIVDGETVITEMVDTSSMTTYTFTVGGEDENVSVVVKLDGEYFYEANADFTDEDVPLSNEKNYNINFYVDVTGMTLDEAIIALSAAGYDNYSVKYDSETDEPAGTVIVQTPGFSTAKHLDKETIIVLTVAKSVEDETANASGDEPTP